MTRLDDATLTRVGSRDGTDIGVWTSGQGPPLVLVHGTTSDHTTWDAVRSYLEPYARLYAMDRRGRGASGDGHGYDLAREFEDVAAVVDTAAQRAGVPVDVLGHSFGGLVAWGAATLTSGVRRLVLYEGWPVRDPAAVALPPALSERLGVLLAAGEDEQAIETFYRRVAAMSEEQLAGYRASPIWSARVAAAHTIPREDQALWDPAATLDPAVAASISVPVLLLVGGDSPGHLTADPEAVAGALPDGRVVVLEGQQHVAHHQVPERFAEHVLGFLRDEP